MVQHGLDVRGDAIRKFLTALVAVLASALRHSRPPLQRRPGAALGSRSVYRWRTPWRRARRRIIGAVSPLRYLLPLLSVTLLRSWLSARLEWLFLAHGLLLIQLSDRPRPGAIRFVWQWRELSPRQAFAKHQTSAKDISDVANRRRHEIPGWTRTPHKLASDRRPGRSA